MPGLRISGKSALTDAKSHGAQYARRRKELKRLTRDGRVCNGFEIEQISLQFLTLAATRPSKGHRITLNRFGHEDLMQIIIFEFEERPVGSGGPCSALPD